MLECQMYHSLIHTYGLSKLCSGRIERLSFLRHCTIQRTSLLLRVIVVVNRDMIFVHNSRHSTRIILTIAEFPQGTNSISLLERCTRYLDIISTDMSFLLGCSVISVVPVFNVGVGVRVGLWRSLETVCFTVSCDREYKTRESRTLL